MANHYWGIRPKRSETDENIRRQYTRIEKADNPHTAFDVTFGRGDPGGYQYKDLGTRVEVLHSDKQRLALLQTNEGWIDFKPASKPRIAKP